MKIFKPASILMGKLKYPYKFALVSFIFIIPLIVLMVILINIRNEAILFGEKERQGLVYLKPVKDLIFLSFEQRSLLYRASWGDSTVSKPVIRFSSKIKEQIAAIDKIDREIGSDLNVKADWSALKADWQEIEASIKLNNINERLLEKYSSFISNVQTLTGKIGDESNLILDPDIDTYYLMDATVIRYPYLIETLQKKIDLSNKLILQSSLDDQEKASFFYILPDKIESESKQLSDNIKKAFDFNQTQEDNILVAELSSHVYDLFATLNSYENIAYLQNTDFSIPDTMAKYYPAVAGNADVTRKSLKALHENYDIEIQLLDKLTENRVAEFYVQKYYIYFLVPVIFIAVLYLLVGFYQSVRSIVETLGEISRKLVAGETSSLAKLDAKDELAELATSFNNIGSTLIARNNELEVNNKLIREQQSQLIQSEKMASLGQMVAGIAHEVNTPLGFVRNNIEVMSKFQNRMIDTLNEYHFLRDQLINGNVDALEEQLNKVSEISKKIEGKQFKDKVDSVLNESLVGIDRIQELVLDLKNFSRLDEESFKLSNINDGIDSALKIANNMIKNKVEVHRDFAGNLDVECFPARMNQVFLNLISNGVQAIPENGDLWISTSREMIESTEYAVISIRDNGKGIPKENLEKIFEPFFTTKPVGEGTGLGLSIVYKIIEQHNGFITVDSEVGKGTTFLIKIPVRQKK